MSLSTLRRLHDSILAIPEAGESQIGLGLDIHKDDDQGSIGTLHSLGSQEDKEPLPRPSTHLDRGPDPHFVPPARLPVQEALDRFNRSKLKLSEEPDVSVYACG